MTKNDAIYLAIERYKKDGKKHTIYNSRSILGYFVDIYKDGYKIYRIIG